MTPYAKGKKGLVFVYRQFFTPDMTANRIAELVAIYKPTDTIFDACSGTGQLSAAIVSQGYSVIGGEIDIELLEFSRQFYSLAAKPDQLSFNHFDYQKDKLPNIVQMIVSNPPYEDIPRFLLWILENLEIDGTTILILPLGFIDKARPKVLVETLGRFDIIHREDMKEPFYALQ